MRRRTVSAFGAACVLLAVTACSTPSASEVEQWAVERGFTPMENSIAWGRSFTSIGVRVGSKCSGVIRFYSEDRYPSMDVFNEHSYKILEGKLDPYADKILSTPPTHACA